MQTLPDNLADVAAAIDAFVADHAAAVPEPWGAVLAAGHPSPVVRVVRGAEALFAAAAGDPAFPAEGVLLCGQLATLAGAHGWHNLGQTDRAGRMVAACRRRLGELDDTEAPPAEDPAPVAHIDEA